MVCSGISRGEGEAHVVTRTLRWGFGTPKLLALALSGKAARRHFYLPSQAVAKKGEYSEQS